jgi:hypothetical protein
VGGAGAGLHSVKVSASLHSEEAVVFASAVPALAHWGEFYVIAGTSAGALTGLMFVVIALRAERETARSLEVMEAFATPTVVHLGTVLLVAGIITVPEHAEWSLSLCLVASGAAGLAYMVWVTLQVWRQTEYVQVFSDWVWRNAVLFVCYVAFSSRGSSPGGTMRWRCTSWPRLRWCCWRRAFIPPGIWRFG